MHPVRAEPRRVIKNEDKQKVGFYVKMSILESVYSKYCRRLDEEGNDANEGEEGDGGDEDCRRA